MKTLAYYLLGIFSLCILNACDNEENPTPEPPPSKGEEAVQEIVEVLKESKPEVSQFVEILEKVDVADLTQDDLTVFAVKNTSTASRAAVLDTASIKNHIAKGSYAKEALTDGSTLTSISNETLYVTRTGNDVLINGVKIEGEAIPVGKSYVYVVPEVIEIQAAEPVIPADSVSTNDISYLWRKSMNNYLNKNWEVEAKVTTGYGGFFYKDIEELSDNYWKAAYATLSEGEKYLNQLEDSESDKNLSDTIKLERALIQAQLYGYYNTYIDGEKVCTINDLIMTCETLTDLLPGTMRDAARLLSAKALLYKEGYAEAITYSEAILNEDNYTLGGNEIIWKGYMDASGNNVDPLLLQEAYIISAIAYYNTGNQNKALELLKSIAGPVSNIENIDTTVYLNLLKGTGEIYPYYRLLTSMNISVSYPLDFGFDVNRNLSFPVPKEAMDEYPELNQNPGY